MTYEVPVLQVLEETAVKAVTIYSLPVEPDEPAVT
jgi:hypothetical protein